MAAVSEHFQRQIPLLLCELWAKSNGLATPEGAIVYSTDELPERNEAFEVETYAPGYFAVGDDSGGRALLMSSAGDAVWVDMGTMDPSRGEALAVPWLEWLELGAPLPEDGDDVDPTYVDIYLERKPEGGLRTLVMIKEVLGLELGAKELLAVAKRAPARLQIEVPFGKALARSRQVNATDDCVGLRPVGSPSRRARAPHASKRWR